ncbi:hypothetical protein ACIBO2_12975 [Nonomuraea sp. NPDC050022]|uniref:hypothetical protein n=1 Tax=unclassified Nonomuraea TaxID=2593643 RepID=UPI0033CC2F8B
MKKTIMTLMMAATVATVIPLAPSPALAEPPPTGCHSGIYYQNYKTWASCDRGSGYVRAVATCPTGKVRGTWKVVSSAIEGQSVATCPGKRKATGHDWEIKMY